MVLYLRIYLVDGCLLSSRIDFTPNLPWLLYCICGHNMWGPIRIEVEEDRQSGYRNHCPYLRVVKFTLPKCAKYRLPSGKHLVIDVYSTWTGDAYRCELVKDVDPRVNRFTVLNRKNYVVLLVNNTCCFLYFKYCADGNWNNHQMWFRGIQDNKSSFLSALLMLMLPPTNIHSDSNAICWIYLPEVMIHILNNKYRL